MVPTSLKKNLCIGCGFCAAACPRNAISMQWCSRSVHVPLIDSNLCNECGLCESICPNESNFLVKRARIAKKTGPAFGVPESAEAFLAHDADPAGRMGGASGGALTVILAAMLCSGKVDGVIGPKPVLEGVGQPHIECTIHSDVDSLIAARSSYYHPLNYAEAIKKTVQESGKKFAILGTPCVMRAVEKLPMKYREVIAYKFCLVCSHNTTGRFTDCLALKEGINSNDPFECDLRHKNKQMLDAGNFFNRFSQEKIECCRNRFETDFTILWRNYFFAMEACIYCPDFYGVEADCSIKDPWGVRDDPNGWSLMLIRSPELRKIIEHFSNEKKIVLESCTLEKFRFSQKATAHYKAIGAFRRMTTHPALKKERGGEILYRLRQFLHFLYKDEQIALTHQFMIRKSNEDYENHGARFSIDDILAEGKAVGGRFGQLRNFCHECWEMFLLPFNLVSKISRWFGRRLLKKMRFITLTR